MQKSIANMQAFALLSKYDDLGRKRFNDNENQTKTIFQRSHDDCIARCFASYVAIVFFHD